MISMWLFFGLVHYFRLTPGAWYALPLIITGLTSFTAELFVYCLIADWATE